MTNVVPILRTQFTTTWSLLQLHLDTLSDEDCHWSPAPPEHTWSVSRNEQGRWAPDWVDTEPDPLPVATIGWLTWHIGWWWSTAIAHVTDQPVPDRDTLDWPGSAEGVRVWLADLHDQWTDFLDGASVHRMAEQATYPWPARPDRAVADTAAWVNIELMKNTAEIGQLRLTRAVSR